MASAERGEALGGLWPLPWSAEVGGQGSGEVELGVSGQDQAGPAVGCGGLAQPWAGPTEDLLEEPEGVLQVEAP